MKTAEQRAKERITIDYPVKVVSAPTTNRIIQVKKAT